MSRILLRLRGVPEDELKEVVELLEQHRIEIYETSAGNWGISMPALWVKDEDDYPRAREILDDYQAQRGQQARAEWDRQATLGTRPTLLQSLTERPMISIGLIVFCGIVAWFSIQPFLTMLE